MRIRRFSRPSLVEFACSYMAFRRFAELCKGGGGRGGGQALVCMRGHAVTFLIPPGLDTAPPDANRPRIRRRRRRLHDGLDHTRDLRAALGCRVYPSPRRQPGPVLPAPVVALRLCLSKGERGAVQHRLHNPSSSHVPLVGAHRGKCLQSGTPSPPPRGSSERTTTVCTRAGSVQGAINPSKRQDGIITCFINMSYIVALRRPAHMGITCPRPPPEPWLSGTRDRSRPPPPQPLRCACSCR